MRAIAIAAAAAIIGLILIVYPCSCSSPSSPVSDVFTRSLVSASLSGPAIVGEHERAATQIIRRFVSAPSMGYITPWNSDGYRTSRVFADKFTYLAPVWFQIKIEHAAARLEEKQKKAKKSVAVRIEGAASVNSEWMQSIRNSSSFAVSDAGEPIIGARPLIVPRFLVEADREAMMMIIASKRVQRSIISQLVSSVSRHALDGLTLELTEAWALVPYQRHKGRVALNQFVVQLANELHAMPQRAHLILVVRPDAPHSTFFGHLDFEATRHAVDAFHLMTYDYASNLSPEQRQAYIKNNPTFGVFPSCPIKWMNATIRAFVGDQHVGDIERTGKVLMGLPFYGTLYGQQKMEAIVGRQFVSRIDERTRFHWNEDAQEHVAIPAPQPGKESEGRELIYYPSLLMLAKRLDLARALGVGVAIWELGQGLEYFYDLL